MRFFRDVSRAKAHARLYGNQAALAVFTSDDVLQLQESLSEPPDVTFSPEELAHLDGQDGKPIYMSVAGRVYDVSSNRATYGPKGTYHDLVAKDASRALALGCLSPRCLSSSLEGLTEKQHKVEFCFWLPCRSDTNGSVRSSNAGLISLTSMTSTIAWDAWRPRIGFRKPLTQR